MAWTTPRTWNAGETVTATLMNTHVRDNLNVLRAEQIKRLTSSGSVVQNVTTGETDLHTYTLPANTLSVDGQIIRYTAHGDAANNANAKTLRFYFGTTALAVTLTINTGVQWSLEALVLRINSTTARVYLMRMTQGAVVIAPNFADVSSVVWSNTFVFKVTGQGTNTGDVRQYLSDVRIEN